MDDEKVRQEVSKCIEKGAGDGGGERGRVVIKNLRTVQTEGQTVVLIRMLTSDCEELVINSCKLTNFSFSELDTHLRSLKVLDLRDNRLPAELAMKELRYITNSVEEINLEKNLLNSFPNWVFQFTHLKILTLSSNSISALPSKLSNLTNLKQLQMSGNKLKEISSKPFQGLTNLTALILKHNEISRLSASLCTCLVSLDRLDLSRNQLKTVPKTISGLTSLTDLRIAKNQLTALPKSLANLSQLRILELQDNELLAFRVPLQRWAKAFPNLKQFNIENNPLNQFTNDLLSRYGSLGLLAKVDQFVSMEKKEDSPKKDDDESTEKIVEKVKTPHQLGRSSTLSVRPKKKKTVSSPFASDFYTSPNPSGSDESRTPDSDTGGSSGATNGKSLVGSGIEGYVAGKRSEKIQRRRNSGEFDLSTVNSLGGSNSFNSGLSISSFTGKKTGANRYSTSSALSEKYQKDKQKPETPTEPHTISTSTLSQSTSRNRAQTSPDSASLRLSNSENSESMKDLAHVSADTLKVLNKHFESKRTDASYTNEQALEMANLVPRIIIAEDATIKDLVMVTFIITQFSTRVVSDNGTTWMDVFFKRGGVRSVYTLMMARNLTSTTKGRTGEKLSDEKVRGLQCEALRLLDEIIKIDIKPVLEERHILRPVALSLVKHAGYEISTLCLSLLTDVCRCTEFSGVNRVFEALEFRRNKIDRKHSGSRSVSKFRFLVDILKSGRDLFKTMRAGDRIDKEVGEVLSAVQLINAILNATKDQSKRMEIRSEMTQIGISSTLAEIKSFVGSNDLHDDQPKRSLGSSTTSQEGVRRQISNELEQFFTDKENDGELAHRKSHHSSIHKKYRDSLGSSTSGSTSVKKSDGKRKSTRVRIKEDEAKASSAASPRSSLASISSSSGSEVSEISSSKSDPKSSDLDSEYSATATHTINSDTFNSEYDNSEAYSDGEDDDEQKHNFDDYIRVTIVGIYESDANAHKPNVSAETGVTQGSTNNQIYVRLEPSTTGNEVAAKIKQAYPHLEKLSPAPWGLVVQGLAPAPGCPAPSTGTWVIERSIDGNVPLQTKFNLKGEIAADWKLQPWRLKIECKHIEVINNLTARLTMNLDPHSPCADIISNVRQKSHAAAWTDHDWGLYFPSKLSTPRWLNDTEKLAKYSDVWTESASDNPNSLSDVNLELRMKPVEISVRYLGQKKQVELDRSKTVAEVIKEVAQMILPDSEQKNYKNYGLYWYKEDSEANDEWLNETSKVSAYNFGEGDYLRYTLRYRQTMITGYFDKKTKNAMYANFPQLDPMLKITEVKKLAYAKMKAKSGMDESGWDMYWKLENNGELEPLDDEKTLFEQNIPGARLLYVKRKVFGDTRDFSDWLFNSTSANTSTTSNTTSPQNELGKQSRKGTTKKDSSKDDAVTNTSSANLSLTLPAKKQPASTSPLSPTAHSHPTSTSSPSTSATPSTTPSITSTSGISSTPVVGPSGSANSHSTILRSLTNNTVAKKEYPLSDPNLLSAIDFRTYLYFFPLHESEVTTAPSSTSSPSSPAPTLLREEDDPSKPIRAGTLDALIDNLIFSTSYDPTYNHIFLFTHSMFTLTRVVLKKLFLRYDSLSQPANVNNNSADNIKRKKARVLYLIKLWLEEQPEDFCHYQEGNSSVQLIYVLWSFLREVEKEEVDSKTFIKILTRIKNQVPEFFRLLVTQGEISEATQADIIKDAMATQLLSADSSSNNSISPNSIPNNATNNNLSNLNNNDMNNMNKAEVSPTTEMLSPGQNSNINANNMANNNNPGMNPNYNLHNTYYLGPVKLPPGELSFMKLDEAEIARHLTVESFSLYSLIRPNEFFNLNWSKPKTQHLSLNLLRFIDYFNSISSKIATALLQEDKVNNRGKLFIKFINVAIELRHLNNFHMLQALISGFNNSAISRLKWTKSRLGSKVVKGLEELEKMMSMEGNFKVYRAVLNELKENNNSNNSGNGNGVVPYIGVCLTDLTFIEEGNPEKIGGLINFGKYGLIYNVITGVLKYQKTAYHIPASQKVLDFLNNLPKFDDKELYRRSLMYEPRNAGRAEIS
eukprot:TRINITY_DN733_c1_g1_i3.p1 TRINITY_DN733_c1_g1~~TRINITY_DN733_c1_g1_i3.p1  ORF type:complete len:2053 (-),score=460.67 TRINITY_DN733_c1_g1_i3:153-6311(-)